MKNNNENMNANHNKATNGRQQSTRNRLMLLGLVLAVILGQAATAKAAVFTVDTTADNAVLTACTAATENDCSIGGAIANANASGETDTINFDATVFGTHQTIHLNNGFSILADGKLTINGSAAGVTLSLANSNLAVRRVFSLFNRNANLEINRLTLTGGRTFQGGAIFSIGTVTVNNSTVTSNSASEFGGGIGGDGGTLMLNNSTVSNNSAGIDSGGIDSFVGTLTLTNSTVSGNSANRFGGGIGNFNGGTVMLTNSTVSGNSAFQGGGIYNNSTLTLNNSIVANSISGGDCFRNSGTINASYSLIQDGFGCVNGTNSNNLTGEPLLGPLQDNGGPSFTHALLMNSPAIDAGNSTLTTDQRGFMRPFDSPLYSNAANGSDIGAFEYQGATPTTKDQCKNGGWKTFDFPHTFKNQGDCIQFVNTGK